MICQNLGGRSGRVVGRSENRGVPVLFGGHNLPPLVEIRLTDLPKSGGVIAPPAPPGMTGLKNARHSKFSYQTNITKISEVSKI